MVTPIIIANLDKSFNKYYNALTKLGYVNHEDTVKLLILSYLHDIIFGEFSDVYNIHKDHNLILNTANLLAGNNCLIDYSASDINITLPKNIRTNGEIYSVFPLSNDTL